MKKKLFLFSTLIFSFTSLRVSEEEEYEGLDVTEHEERGYDLT